jgi:hypothetical protein
MVYRKGHWIDGDCLVAFNYVCETPQPVDICEGSILIDGNIYLQFFYANRLP